MEAGLLLDAQSNSWYNHYQCVDATERLAGVNPVGTQNSPHKGAAQTTQQRQQSSGSSPLVNEIARAREKIKKSLQSDNESSETATNPDLANQVACLKKENQELRKITDDLRALVLRLDGRVTSLEKGGTAPAPACAAAEPKEDEEEDDDDFDPFASESEEEDDAEKDKERQAKLDAYHAKKANKKVVIAKSSLVIDVKPWEAETDMKALEDSIRSITMDGLLWGASKLVPVAFGVKKLQISCVIEDDKVSTDDLQEQMEAFEDFVQSTDIAAFNKI